MKKLPSKFSKRALALSKSLGYPVEDVVATYYDMLKSIKEKKVETTDPEKLAFTRTILKLKAEARTLKAVPTRYVYLFGTSGLEDTLDIIRRRATRAMEENFEQAVKDKLVTPSGEILDTRETLFGRVPNPNYKSPLPPNAHEWRRVFYGLVSDEEKFDSISISALRAYRDLAQKTSGVKLWKYYSFKAPEKTIRPSIQDAQVVIKSQVDRIFNIVPGTRLQLIEKPLEPYELLNKLELIELWEVESKLKEDEKAGFRPIYPILGFIEDIRTSEERTMVFMESDRETEQHPLTVFLPPFINVEPLAIGYEVAFFGRLSMSRDRPVLNSVGYIIRSK